MSEVTWTGTAMESIRHLVVYADAPSSFDDLISKPDNGGVLLASMPITWHKGETITVEFDMERRTMRRIYSRVESANMRRTGSALARLARRAARRERRRRRHAAL